MDAGIMFQEDFFMMKKRIRDLMYLLIVLAVIFTGAACSTSSDDDDPPPPNPAPTVVVLAAGSYGTAGNSAITGLTDSTTYVVSTGGQYFGVQADGTLGSGTDLDDAIAEAVGITDGAAGITGLTNGTAYNVYELMTGMDGASADLDAAAYNAVIDISALVNGETYILNADTSTPSAKSVIVYVDQALKTKTGGVVADAEKFRGDTLDYILDATTPDGVTFGAVTANDTGITFNLSAITGFTFTTTIKVTTAVAEVALAAGSYGIPGG
jgi:hypothetical protein